MFRVYWNYRMVHLNSIYRDECRRIWNEWNSEWVPATAKKSNFFVSIQCMCLRVVSVYYENHLLYICYTELSKWSLEWSRYGFTLKCLLQNQLLNIHMCMCPCLEIRVSEWKTYCTFGNIENGFQPYTVQ